MITLNFKEDFDIPEVGDMFTALTWNGDVVDLQMDEDGICTICGGEDGCLPLYEIRAIGVWDEDLPQVDNSQLIFLRENDWGCNDGGQKSVFAIPANKIHILNVCDTYDRYGHEVGEIYARDSFEIQKDLPQFGLSSGDVVYHDHDELINIIAECGNDIIEEKNTVEGFNYYDGRNWQTITVESDKFELTNPTHFILDDEESVKYKRIIDIYERCGKCPGVSVLEPKFWGDWEKYRITIL